MKRRVVPVSPVELLPLQQFGIRIQPPMDYNDSAQERIPAVPYVRVYNPG